MILRLLMTLFITRYPCRSHGVDDVHVVLQGFPEHLFTRESGDDLPRRLNPFHSRHHHVHVNDIGG